MNRNLLIRNLSKPLSKIIVGIAAIIMCASAIFADASDAPKESNLDVYRVSNNIWYSRSRSEEGSYSAVKWGLSNDVLVPADYDGDGGTDIAVWRPSSGMWYIRQSSTDQIIYAQWGMTTHHPTGGLPDVPVPADYDGDGKTDIAVWRPDTGFWYVLNSSNGYDQRNADIFQWGRLGDIPVQADYDGDGRADHAIFRSWENRWYIFESKAKRWNVQKFGAAGSDMLVPADYTGDGKADVAVFRSGTWWILNSENGEAEATEFGFEDSIPVPADYDGDGETDLAVFRKGAWYIYESSGPRLVTHTFGLENDVPINFLRAKPSIIGVP